MRTAWAATVWLTLASLAAQSPSQRPRSPEERFFEQAMAAPPELFADLVFRYIETRAPDRAAQTKLLTQVVEGSFRIRQTTPMRQVVGADSEEGRAAAQARELSLDRMSVVCRAVTLLLAVDPKTGRQMWARVPPLTTAPVQCDSGAVPSPELYFETLTQVVLRAPFTDEERGKQVPAQMVERAFGAIRTSAELASALAVVPRLREAGIDSLRLSASLTSAVEGVSDSSRGFRAALAKQGLVAALEKAFPDGSGVAMFSAFRGYMARHLAGPQCQDNLEMGVEEIESFNRLAATTFGMVPPLTEKERAAGKTTTERFVPKRATDPGFLALLSEIRQFAPQAPDAHYQVTGWLRRVEEWRGREDGSPAELFQQKAELWRLLCELLPEGDLSDRAREGLTQVLSDQQLMRQSPVAWKAQVNRSLRLERAAQALRQSSNRVLTLYAELEVSAAKP